MIRIYLLLFLLIALYFGIRVFISTPPATITKNIKILLAGIIVVIFCYLLATGRMNWIFGMLGVFMAFLARFMPVLLRFSPFLTRFWTQHFSAKKHKTGGSRPSGAYTGMSDEEAYEVLGLKTDASREEIIAAHRRLIQKIHPDHGGSDYLAVKINLAKKVLLKN